MSAAQRVIHELTEELMRANQEAHECRIAFQEMRAALKESQAIVREQGERLRRAEHAVRLGAQQRSTA
jgi:hypothetical protein